MSAMQNELNPQINLVQIGTQAASITLPGPQAEKARRIKAVKLINQAALAQDDTNYLVVNLLLNGASVATVSSKLTGGTGPLVANTPLAAVLAAPIDMAVGDQLTVQVVKNGTGAPTLALLQLEWFAK